MTAENAPFSTKDSDNMPITNIDSEHFQEVYSKLYGIIYEGNGFYIAGNTASGLNIADRLLFYVSLYRGIFGTSRQKEHDYGAIPFPKFDEEQDDYKTPMHSQAELMFVPNDDPDLERTGIITQSLAYESVNTVKHAFYEIASKVKMARDENSAEMLDIISIHAFMTSYIFSTGVNLLMTLQRFWKIKTIQ